MSSGTLITMLYVDFELECAKNYDTRIITELIERVQVLGENYPFFILVGYLCLINYYASKDRQELFDLRLPIPGCFISNCTYGFGEDVKFGLCDWSNLTLAKRDWPNLKLAPNP